MKKLTILCLSMLLSASINAQFYGFKWFEEPYEEIVGGRELSLTSTSWSLKTEEEFEFFGSKDYVILQVYDKGVIQTPGGQYNYSISPMFADLQSRGPNSKISVKVDEVAGKNIYKIEWKDMGFKGHDTGDFANFQIWVYEESQHIEMRYGKSRITGTEAFYGEFKLGASIALTRGTTSPNKTVEIHKIRGEGKNFGYDYNIFSGYYVGVPDSGVVLHFYNRAYNSVGSTKAYSLNLYPNPVEDQFNIEGDFDGSESLTIRNNLGQEIYNQDKIGVNRKFDVSFLAPGFYIVEVRGKNISYTGKLIK